MKTTSKILIATVLLGSVAAVAVPVMAQNAQQPAPQVEDVRFDGPRGPGGHGPQGEEHRGPRGGERHGPGGQAGPGQLLRFFDTDQNGVISPEELNAKLASYDTNSDGNLSLDEFEGLWAEVTNQMMVRSFQFLDRDGDASVTQAELSEPIEHFANRMADMQDDDDDDHGPRRGGGWRPWR